MRDPCLFAILIAGSLASAATAKERPVTDDERAKLVAAVAGQDTGGKLEFNIDDNQFEVDDVTCNDDRKYDLKFDPSFKLLKTELED